MNLRSKPVKCKLPNLCCQGDPLNLNPILIHAINIAKQLEKPIYRISQHCSVTTNTYYCKIIYTELIFQTF